MGRPWARCLLPSQAISSDYPEEARARDPSHLTVYRTYASKLVHLHHNPDETLSLYWRENQEDPHLDRADPAIEPAGNSTSPNLPVTPEQPTASKMLNQVAIALGIPPEALVRSGLRYGDRARVLAENAEALQIFAGIADPKAREQCLAYLRWIADQNAPR